MVWHPHLQLRRSCHRLFCFSAKFVNLNARSRHLQNLLRLFNKSLTLHKNQRRRWWKKETWRIRWLCCWLAIGMEFHLSRIFFSPLDFDQVLAKFTILLLQFSLYWAQFVVSGDLKLARFQLKKLRFFLCARYTSMKLRNLNNFPVRQPSLDCLTKKIRSSSIISLSLSSLIKMAW